MLRNTLPYPPRPRRVTLAEPSIDWRIRLAFAVLGANRAAPPRVVRRLMLSGLTEQQLKVALSRIRTTERWWRVWEAEADASAAREEWGTASAQAFIGQLVLSPFHPQKAHLKTKMRRWHQQERAGRDDSTFEARMLAGGRLSVYVETPRNATRPPFLLLPPLASTKEELGLLADILLAAGHTVIRMDLPGQGESPGPLPLDAETRLSAALDELKVTELFAGGLSLGAFFALRLAACDTRVRGVFGVSPPAISTPNEWRRLPEVIWQYLDGYFEGETRADTYAQAHRLTLEELAGDIRCPVLLFHGLRDTISPPDAPHRYRALLTQAVLTERLLDDGHSCLLHLRDTVGPEVAEWAAAILAEREAARK